MGLLKTSGDGSDGDVFGLVLSNGGVLPVEDTVGTGTGTVTDVTGTAPIVVTPGAPGAAVYNVALAGGAAAGSFLIFPTIAAMSAFSTTSPTALTTPGTQAFVQSNGSWWTLQTDGTSVADGITIVTAAPGEPRKWKRENIAGYQATDIQKQTWYIDPQNVTAAASDEAPGTIAAPLKTFAELTRRLGYTTSPLFPEASGIAVTFLSSQTANTDPIFFAPLISGGAPAILSGAPVPVQSGIVAGVVTPKNKATGTRLQVAGFPAGTVAGMLVFNQTRNSYAFIDSITGGLVATMQQPLTGASTTVANVPAPIEDNGWTAGDLLETNTLIALNLERWDPVASDESAGGAQASVGFTIFVEVIDSSGNGSSSYNHINRAIANTLAHCKVDPRLNVVSNTGRGNQCYLVNCTAARAVQVISGAANFNGGGYAAGLTTQGGSQVVLANDVTLHGGVIVSAGSSLNPTSAFGDGAWGQLSGGVLQLLAAGCVWGSFTNGCSAASTVYNNSATTWALAWLATGQMSLGALTTGSGYVGGGVFTDGIAITPANIDTGAAAGPGLQDPRTGARYCNVN